MNPKDNIAIFLAARSGSRRLPNKHFYLLNSKYSAIDICIKRLKKSKYVNKIFLCTTKKKEDDKFKKVSENHNIKLFRGSENNVLKRFIDCAKENSITNIVRITADCPLIDPQLIDKCLQIHIDKKLDYTSNILKLSYPDGLDVEIIKLNALIKSQKLKKKDVYNCEHVTAFIRSSNLFKKYNLANLENFSDRRWTLDNKKDLIYLRRVFKHFSPDINFSWKKLIVAEKNYKFLMNIKNRINNKIEFKKKIIIGCANFTQNYGLNSKKVSFIEIKKILNLAKKNKISQIDTAASYLEDNLLFKKNNFKFNIISKVKPGTKWTSLKYCKKELDLQLKKLNHKIDTILFHDLKILYKKEGKIIFNNLKILKEKGYFNKIGISIYDPSCLSYLTSKYEIQVVQCPYNIFDKRIIETGWFSKLKTKGIEIHARSIFLQGLLVNNDYSKIEYFKKWKKKFSVFYEYLKKNKISNIDYCINDLIKHDFDYIVVGIDSYKNLNQILNFKLLKNQNKIIDFKLNDLKLIDPREWKRYEN